MGGAGLFQRFTLETLFIFIHAAQITICQVPPSPKWNCYGYVFWNSYVRPWSFTGRHHPVSIPILFYACVHLIRGGRTQHHVLGTNSVLWWHDKAKYAAYKNDCMESFVVGKRQPALSKTASHLLWLCPLSYFCNLYHCFVGLVLITTTEPPNCIRQCFDDQ